MRNLPLFIAGRYLLARKSHNVINMISAISVAGMAIGTAALTAILSVFNGFEAIVSESLGDSSPDILISPAEGKTFIAEGEAFDWLYGDSRVLNMCSVLQDKVYVEYAGKSCIATAKGADRVFEEESTLSGHITAGEFTLRKGDVPLAVSGSAVASSLGVDPRFLDAMVLCYPRAEGQFTPGMGAAALNRVKVYPSGVFDTGSQIGNDLVIVPIESMRELLGLDREVSGIEIRLREDCTDRDAGRIISTLRDMLGDRFLVNGRIGQNISLYRMMRYEKMSVFLILLFVTVIIAFNIFSSLSMLIMEKEEDMRTLRCLGAGESLIRKIFVLEGWMISLTGMGAGILAGMAAVFIQQKSGILKMPGSFGTMAYPVYLRAGDIAATALAVAAIGYLTAYLPVAGKRTQSASTGSSLR